MVRLSKVRPSGTCANLPVCGNCYSFKSGKMVQNVSESQEKSGNLKVRHGWPPWINLKSDSHMPEKVVLFALVKAPLKTLSLHKILI